MKHYGQLLITLIFISVLILIFISIPSYAFGSYSASITPIENSFYGIDYAEEKDEKRLERLEETVYGKIQTGDIKTRLNKLKQDISADLIGKEMEGKLDTFADDTPEEKEIYKADESVKYPVVDSMEKIVFKKSFDNSEINNRLTNLEQEVFNQVYPSDDLYTRVDRLKKTLLIEENKYLANYDDVFTSENPSYEDFENYRPNYDRGANDYTSSNPTIAERENQTSIEELEKSILKKRYTKDDENTRLSRIENKLFQTDFQEDDRDTRLNRINMAYTAQKGSNTYKGLAFQEKMATVLQIGMTVLMILAMVL